jgi:hypothetical protein
MTRSAATPRIESLQTHRKGADTIEVRVITYPKPVTANHRPNGV